jgi:hypothetical protein
VLEALAVGAVADDGSLSLGQFGRFGVGLAAWPHVQVAPTVFVAMAEHDHLAGNQVAPHLLSGQRTPACHAHRR